MFKPGITFTDSLDKLRVIVRREQERSRSGHSRVTFTAPYALYVHEAVEMVLKGKPRPSGIGVYWGPNGMAKFLETPMKERWKDIEAIMQREFDAGRTIKEASYVAALALLDWIRPNVPIEYGDLIDSATVVKGEW